MPQAGSSDVGDAQWPSVFELQLRIFNVSCTRVVSRVFRRKPGEDEVSKPEVLLDVFITNLDCLPTTKQYETELFRRPIGVKHSETSG